MQLPEEIEVGEVGGRGGSLSRPRRALGRHAWGLEGPLARPCASRWRCGPDLESLLLDGSTRLVTDPDGDVMQDVYHHQDQWFTYDAYGNLLETPDYRVTMFLYAGEQYTAATDLYYLRARYYDPSTGRFTALDPAAGSPQDPISLHKYLYAGANPVMNTDPTGQFYMADVLTGTAIMATINAAIGGVTGSITYRSWRGALGGAVGAFAGTVISIPLAALCPAVGPFAFGLGAALNTAMELWIARGPGYLHTVEAKVHLGTSFVLGFAVGAVTQTATTELARGLGEKMLSIPSIRVMLAQAAGRKGVQLRSITNVADYCLSNPEEFTRAVLRWLRPDAFYAVKGAISKGLVGGFFHGVVTPIGMQFAKCVADAIDAMTELIEKAQQRTAPYY